MKEGDYEETKPEFFSDEIPRLEKAIENDKKNALNYYYLAKEYILKVPIRAIPDLNYLEELLKNSIKLNNNLWAPKIFLGEILFKQGKFNKAKKYLEKAAIEKPESVSVKEFLSQCNNIENSSIEKYSERQLLYMFENTLRNFIKNILTKDFDNLWWRKGVPTKTRACCAARREEGLEEEMEKELLLFANFYDYKMILQHNKNIFSQILDVREWCKKLDELEPIRNVIAHNRDIKTAKPKIKEIYDHLKKIIEKKINQEVY